jgi:hypothetical protein
VVWNLEVRRSEFLEALRRTTSAATKRAPQPPVLFSFSDGRLSVEALGITAEIPASGEWPGVAAVPAHLLRQLARTLPNDDPLRLQAGDNKLIISRFSMPCECRPSEAAVSKPEPADTAASLDSQDLSGTHQADGAWPVHYFVERDKRVREIVERAAGILKPYGVSGADLQSLVEKHVASGLNPFASAERPVIKCIAQAWTVLAPLGVEPGEIKALMDEAIKNVWKR